MKPYPKLVTTILLTSLALSGCAVFSKKTTKESEATNQTSSPGIFKKAWSLMPWVKDQEIVQTNTQETPTTEAAPNDREPDLGPPKVIDPQVARRIVSRFTPKLGNVEAGFWGGATAIEGVSTNSTFGVALGLYLSEDFFLRLDAGRSKVARTDYAITLQQLNTDSSINFDTQSLSIGYSFLPGEAYFGRSAVLNSTFYVVAGLGVVRFPIIGIASPSTQQSRKIAQNFGAGFKIFPNDKLNINTEIGNRLYRSDITGFTRYSNNIEMRVGVNFIF